MTPDPVMVRLSEEKCPCKTDLLAWGRSTGLVWDITDGAQHGGNIGKSGSTIRSGHRRSSSESADGPTTGSSASMRPGAGACIEDGCRDSAAEGEVFRTKASPMMPPRITIGKAAGPPPGAAGFAPMDDSVSWETRGTAETAGTGSPTATMDRPAPADVADENAPGATMEGPTASLAGSSTISDEAAASPVAAAPHRRKIATGKRITSAAPCRKNRACRQHPAIGVRLRQRIASQ